jgi:hypothetical protein
MIRHCVWLAAIFLGSSIALEVAPNSPCGKKCIDDPKNGNTAWSNASLTFGFDLPCLDSDYIGKNATKVGKKLSDCQTCMQSSGWEDAESGERDTTWFMCKCALCDQQILYSLADFDVADNIDSQSARCS